jgi:hypothetical protein
MSVLVQPVRSVFAWMPEAKMAVRARMVGWGRCMDVVRCGIWFSSFDCE